MITPSKQTAFVKPGSVVVNAKWRNSNLIDGLKGLFNAVKVANTNDFDFCLPNLNVVYFPESTLVTGIDADSLGNASNAVFIADRNTLTLDMYAEVQKLLFDKGKFLLPVGHSGEVPLLLHQLNLADTVHSPGSTFRAPVKAPSDIQVQLLLNVPGLGKAKAVKLLNVFGSVQKTAFASLESLSRVVGAATASQVYSYFHDIIKQK